MAAEQKQFCVFDVAGAGGFVYKTLQEYQRKMVKSGVKLAMTPYTDEDQAVADFRAGQCDIVALTDMGVRHFNDFTGSISAIGAVPYYEDLRVLMHILSSPRVNGHLAQDGHEILGVAPMGAAYLFVNDRNIDHVDALKGKRITVFEGHHDARHMVEYVGAVPVDAKISNFARLFNTGEADISYAPAAAYEVLEMFRGMGTEGGIIRYPVGQVTVQLVARHGEFDERFVRQSRKTVSRLYPEAIRVIRQYEESIPAERWVNISPQAINGYQEMLRSVRIDMQQSTGGSGMLAAGAYDDDMMTILRKVRCYTNPGAGECSAADRE
ncbi:MAG: putative solute-binding protein [Pseudomonadota bacterium]